VPPLSHLRKQAGMSESRQACGCHDPAVFGHVYPCGKLGPHIYPSMLEQMQWEITLILAGQAVP